MADCTCNADDGHAVGCEVYDTDRMQELRQRITWRKDELSKTISRIAPDDVIPGNLYFAAVSYAEACCAACIEDMQNANGLHSPILGD